VGAAIHTHKTCRFLTVCALSYSQCVYEYTHKFVRMCMYEQVHACVYEFTQTYPHCIIKYPKKLLQGTFDFSYSIE